MQADHLVPAVFPFNELQLAGLLGDVGSLFASLRQFRVRPKLNRLAFQAEPGSLPVKLIATSAAYGGAAAAVRARVNDVAGLAL